MDMGRRSSKEAIVHIPMCFLVSQLPHLPSLWLLDSMLLLENNMLLFHFYPIVYAMETLISVHSRLQKSCYTTKPFKLALLESFFCRERRCVTKGERLCFCIANNLIFLAWSLGRWRHASCGLNTPCYSHALGLPLRPLTFGIQCCI